MQLSDLDHLRTVPEIRFREEIVNGEKLTIVCYMIGNQELWKISNAIDCRGITFDSNGNCVSRPFEKFFNVNEQPTTQLHLIRDHVSQVLEKRDGSMVTSCLIGDQVWLKTKKSFYSDVAKLANKRLPPNIREFCYEIGIQNKTAIFEFICKEFPVVVEYNQSQPFTLLAVRDNLTGDYLPYDELTKFNIPLITRFNKSIDDILTELSTIKDFEGYVIILDNGVRVKLKSKWYLSLHHLLTQIRERDIALMVIEETIDDAKSMIVSNGLDLTPLLEIEKQVVAQLDYLIENTQKIVATCKQQQLNFKEIAEKYKNHELFSLIMSEMRNQEANYKKFWKNKYYNEYSLRCIYNHNF